MATLGGGWSGYPDADGLPIAHAATGMALTVGTGKSVKRGRLAASWPDELR